MSTDFGFIKVASAVPSVKVADCDYNTSEIIALMRKADDEGVALVVFPELCLTAYTCADLFTQPFLIEASEHSLGRIVEESKAIKTLAVVGMPVEIGGRLFNCAIVVGNGKIYGAVPKTYLPNYGEFYEARWFSPSPLSGVTEIILCGQKIPFGNLLFNAGDAVVGIEICEDLWTPIPPSSYEALHGANVIVNLSASNDMVGKHQYLTSLVKQQSARTISAYIYASCGYGESSTDLVFGGSSYIVENGSVLAEGKRFEMNSQMIVADIDLEKIKAQRLHQKTFYSSVESKIDFTTVDIEMREDSGVHEVKRYFEPYPFIPNDDRTMSERCEEIFSIQINGFAQRYIASYSKCAVIGISGGLDSTLALLVAVRTMDKLGLSRKNVLGVTMPGFGTTGRTYNNAINLMKELGITIREISIKDACVQHFKDIDLPLTDRSVTYENGQARMRTLILMDLANKEGGLVVGTGDLSELALGWATYNGDHMSMYGVNTSVPKTLVKYLVKWVALDGTDEKAKPYLLDIVDTPISPELLPADEKGNIAQKTEDLVGPYELHDFFLYNYVRFGFGPKKLYFMAQRAFDGKYENKVIKKWLVTFMRRFFNQQFKRSALPDGPKVGSVSLSPRGDWRMPSDAQSKMWLAEADMIETE
ncbi:MAG: NAD(+) synthase [Bacteroidales bacterium]|nr:NAD(+) synthase [Bacteroidales bacterium]